MNKETRVWIEDRIFREMTTDLPTERWSNRLGSYVLQNLRKDTASSPDFEDVTLSAYAPPEKDVLHMRMKDGRVRELYMPRLNGHVGIAYTQIHNFLNHLANVLDGTTPLDDFEAEIAEEERRHATLEAGQFGAGA